LPIGAATMSAASEAHTVNIFFMVVLQCQGGGTPFGAS
jgi:hypothetical protein